MTSLTTTAAHVPSLFNDPRFHALNGVESLHLEHAVGGRVIGSIGGMVDGERFVSGHSAPFGGFDVGRDREAPTAVGALVDGVLAQLTARGVDSVIVRLPPPCHHPSIDVVLFALLQRGFAVVDSDLNQHVDLAPFSDADDYLAALRSPARRALRHAAREPWSTADAGDDVAAWDAGYELLRANRAAKGRRLSLDRAYVERARLAFPGRIRMLLLRHGADAVAAAMTYRVREGVELVVAWGDGPHDLPRSPMNRLAYEVAVRAVGERVRVLDLGTSTAPDGDVRRPDDGLVQFKQSVGATVQARLVLARTPER